MSTDCQTDNAAMIEEDFLYLVRWLFIEGGGDIDCEGHLEMIKSRFEDEPSLTEEQHREVMAAATSLVESGNRVARAIRLLQQ